MLNDTKHDNIDSLWHKGDGKSDSKQERKAKNPPISTPMPPDWEPDDLEPDDEHLRFKKKDGSNRYECEKSESPEWKETRSFKDQYRTNGQNGKNKEYYRWDHKHKDIEVYNDKGKYVGSKDPVTGKMYRKGNMVKNPQLERIIK